MYGGGSNAHFIPVSLRFNYIKAITMSLPLGATKIKNYFLFHSNINESLERKQRRSR